MRSTAQLILVCLGALLFNYLFWQEGAGLNLLLFTVFYLSALWYIFPEGRRSRGFQVMAVGTMVLAGMVVWHGSGAARMAWLVSAARVAGFAQEGALRFVLHAFSQYGMGWLQMPGHFIGALSEVGSGNKKRGRRWGQQVRLAIAPLSVVVVFYGLYYAANDKFALWSNNFWTWVGQWVHFSLGQFLFVLLGLFLIGAAFWRNKTNLLENEQRQPDALLRQRPPRRPKRLYAPHTLALRQEYRQSLFLFWMLNLLLLLVNLTDIRYVWFGFDEAAKEDLKGYVHEGTYILIASILLAMGVLFHVFRKNLNFLPDNRPLRTAAKVWLLQNAVLALSVGVRNWRYIDFHGLAYKRIGVVLFLLLVFFGLVTLWLKIRRRRTMHWLWRQNGWAVYGLLVLNACVNWDVWITAYNLSGRPKAEIDVDFLVHTVSDKNLFLLEKNRDRLAQMPMYPVLTASDIEQGVLAKRASFNQKMESQHWKSWNGSDARNEE